MTPDAYIPRTSIEQYIADTYNLTPGYHLTLLDDGDPGDIQRILDLADRYGATRTDAYMILDRTDRILTSIPRPPAPITYI